MKGVSTLGIIAAAAFFCAAPLSLHWSPAKSPSLALDTADARIGHPGTAMSVAGVHRRAMRRHVAFHRPFIRRPVLVAAAVGTTAYGTGWGGGWGGWGWNRPLYSAAPGWGGGWGGWSWNRPLYSCSGPFCGGWGWRRW